MIQRLTIFAIVFSCMSLPAGAVEIDFVQSSVGSGTIGNINFSNTPFTITSVGDTTSRLTFNISGNIGFSIQHASSSITIGNLGTFQFQAATRTFVSNTQQVAGFGFFDPNANGADLLDGPQASNFATWDMLSSIGPTTGNVFYNAGFNAWTPTTSGGDLSMTTSGPITFSATIVPEPSTLALLTLGGVIALAAKRRAA
jgi:hypothetical protein